MDSLVARLPEIVIQLLAFAVAISVHESAHGWVAERLGDPTARWLGRITLNPLKHIDPIGTVLFPLMLAAVGAPIIGWAKPVPFVSRNLRNPRRDPALVGLAGPASNLALAAVVTAVLLVVKAGMPSFRTVLMAMLQNGSQGAGGVAAPLIYLLFSLAMINIVLAVFNLIPIPPLDGSHVVGALLPPALHWRWAQFERYGFLLLIALLWTGFLSVILRPFVTGLLWILLS
ncbi:MAG: site-2 protease family protein [Thermoanaerobaculaceae bacterium]|nr:site-2 protease family protein [Thermoanaerobaculaceae bacterium]